jgi:hypothetical protein
MSPITEGAGNGEPQGLLGPEGCVAQLWCRVPGPIGIMAWKHELVVVPFTGEWAACVKTSTAAQPGGATVEEIPLMRATGGPQVVVKSAAYVTDIGKTLALYAAGARRCGTGDTQAILAGRKNKLAMAGARAELATASIHHALASGRSGEGVRVPGSRTQFTSPWRHSPPRSPSSPSGRGRLGRSPAGDSDSPDSTRAPRRSPSAPPSACSPWAYPHWPCW